MSEGETLLCWHAARAGLDVLEKTLGCFSNRKTEIGRVIYLVQTATPVDVPAKVRGVPVEVIQVALTDPSSHVAIRDALVALALPRVAGMSGLHVNISPGTPAMHAVWLVLHAGGALPPGTLLWSSQYDPKTKRTSLNPVEVPLSTFLREARELARRRGTPAMYAPDTTRSPARIKALDRVARFSRLGGVPLLVLGERGTGKTRLVETAIRTMKGAKKPFVVIPCGSMDSSLFDSTLFGHRAGAYTGAREDRAGLIRAADGGTLFLDEVQDMPAQAQRKLVRLLEEGRYRPTGADEELEADVDIVCATNLTLTGVRERLDPDLFDRISHLMVRVPPLRECREDLAADWQGVWAELSVDEKLPNKAPWTPALSKALTEHALPGNFRDLQRLAALTAAWLMDAPETAAIEEALEEWREWTDVAPTVDEDSRFGSGTRDQRVDAFKRELARWAKARWGTWDSAAAALECGERTLRRDDASA